MGNENKPKEFWIEFESNCETNVAWTYEPATGDNREILPLDHVIEYSAYETAQAEIARLREALELCTINEENRNRLYKVDPETIRKLLLHINWVARAALAREDV